jgi:hypothetical protein
MEGQKGEALQKLLSWALRKDLPDKLKEKAHSRLWDSSINMYV